jgi:RNA polymerase sigma-70 factor, ECF subfamily
MTRNARSEPLAREPRGEVRALPALDGISDGDLVERAQRGDGWAEEAIYRRHARAILGLSLRLLRNRADAEDVAQETFALGLEQLGQVRDGAALRAWLSQIAVSLVRRRARRRKLLSLVGLGPTAGDATLEALASPSQSPEVRAELRALDGLLQKLPIEQRIAWMLRYVEGYDLDEVAAACDCSLATAKRRIAAADARVKIHARPMEGAS